MLGIIRPKNAQQRASSNKKQPPPSDGASVVSRPLAHARDLHVTVDADGRLVGVPAEWQADLEALLKVNAIDKTPENLDRAAQVAQTSFKLRVKRQLPKNMRLEEEGGAAAAAAAVLAAAAEGGGPRVRKNMPLAEVMAEIRSLCRTGSVTKVYKMVGYCTNGFLYALFMLLYLFSE
jgi:hypothetical protein